eukprot:366442-Chlamydomonas_euryale.AAC.8
MHTGQGCTTLFAPATASARPCHTSQPVGATSTLKGAMLQSLQTALGLDLDQQHSPASSAYVHWYERTESRYVHAKHPQSVHHPSHASRPIDMQRPTLMVTSMTRRFLHSHIHTNNHVLHDELNLLFYFCELVGGLVLRPQGGRAVRGKGRGKEGEKMGAERITGKGAGGKEERRKGGKEERRKGGKEERSVSRLNAGPRHAEDA